MVDPVTVGGNDKVVVVTSCDKSLGFLVENPVVVAVMNCREAVSYTHLTLPTNREV